MEDNAWIWWVVAALVLLAIVAAVLAASRRRKVDAARAEAGQIRERAEAGETYVSGAEDRARELQERAREAEARAEQLRHQADDATHQARDHRDRVTEDYLRADEVDPDVKGDGR